VTANSERSNVIVAVQRCYWTLQRCTYRPISECSEQRRGLEAETAAKQMHHSHHCQSVKRRAYQCRRWTALPLHASHTRVARRGRIKTKFGLMLQQWRRSDYAKGRARLCRPPTHQFPLALPLFHSLPFPFSFALPLSPFLAFFPPILPRPSLLSGGGAYWRHLANTMDRYLLQRQIGTQLPRVFKFRCTMNKYWFSII